VRKLKIVKIKVVAEKPPDAAYAAACGDDTLRSEPQCGLLSLSGYKNL